MEILNKKLKKKCVLCFCLFTKIKFHAFYIKKTVSKIYYHEEKINDKNIYIFNQQFSLKTICKNFIIERHSQQNFIFKMNIKFIVSSYYIYN